jgi:hypothetical protein
VIDHEKEKNNIEWHVVTFLFEEGKENPSPATLSIEGHAVMD